MKLGAYRQAWVGSGLQPANHDVTSGETSDYNCVAWALSRADVWVWPAAPDAWWPMDVPNEESVGAFQALFAREGFVACGDGRLEPGYERLAVFALSGSPTHVSRQLPDGKWTSKLGSWEDISHAAPEALSGSRYGQVALFMKRRT